MINKIKIYSRIVEVIILIIMFVFILVVLHNCKRYKEESVRLKNNQISLVQGVKTYRDKFGKSIAEVNALTLKKGEFEQLYQNKVSEIKDLNIEIKRLKSYTSTNMNTNIPIVTIFHDSIFIVNNKIDTLRCINYSDDYFSINACMNDDTLIGRVNSIDTLIQTVSIIPKKFLFFKWGVKGIKQTIKSKNPYTTIISSEYIELN